MIKSGSEKTDSRDMDPAALNFPRELLLPARIVFRAGSFRELAALARPHGPRGLVVHGHSLEAGGFLEEAKRGFGAGTSVRWHCRRAGEPGLSELEDLLAMARESGAQWVAGAGGGSVLDLSKAVAGLFHAKEKPSFYQRGAPLEKPGIPFLAVPTTAGTGSEATPNAVIADPARQNKLSIRDAGFMAKAVILDPLLLKNLPAPVMAYSAMDALVQGYEAFISRNATRFTDALALEAVRLVSRHVLPAVRRRSEEDLAALLLGSFSAGVALAAARLGVIHGIAHPLGFLCGVPHGLVCSVCLPASIKLNRDAMGEKYDTLSRAAGKDFAARADELIRELGMVSPFRGRPVPERETVIRETLASGSTAANPRAITREDVEFLLAEVFGGS